MRNIEGRGKYEVVGFINFMTCSRRRMSWVLHAAGTEAID
jgi:hypothetical protein